MIRLILFASPLISYLVYSLYLFIIFINRIIVKIIQIESREFSYD